MNDIPRDVSSTKLLNSLLVPPHGQDMTPTTLQPHVLCGCIITDSRLDDELSVATIAFSDTPKWLRDLNCDRNGFPKICTFGTIWRAVDLEETDEQGRTEFHRAVMAGNLLHAEMVAEFEDTDPNIQDEQHRTALHWACAGGRPDMVMLCLSIPGCDIGLKDSDGLTAFDLSRRSEHRSSAEAIQTLFYKSMFELEQENPQGALLQILTLTSDPASGDKPIFPGEAIFAPIVDRNSPLVVALIKRGIDLTATNQDGDTALHLASAIVENTEIATRLLEAGSDVNAIGNGGATPIHRAAAVDARMVQVLLKWDADVTITDEQDKSSLHWAAQNGQVDVSRILLEHGVDAGGKDRDGRTALELVEGSQELEHELVTLLRGEMDKLERDHGGTVSPAMQENEESNQYPVQFTAVPGIVDQHQDQVQTVQPAIVKTEVADSVVQQTLHQAVATDDLESVRLLLFQGADVEALDGEGLTPLLVAAKTGHIGVLSALLTAGARTAATDSAGSTALHRAAEYGHPKIIDALTAGGAPIEAVNSFGQTALFLAARWGQTSAIETLLACGAEAETAQIGGMSALCVAAIVGHHSTVGVLLVGGASTEAADSVGWTALHWAVASGDVDIVKALLAGGARIDAPSQSGTALELAIELSRVQVVELLRDWAAGIRVDRVDHVEHDARADHQTRDDRQEGERTKHSLRGVATMKPSVVRDDPGYGLNDLDRSVNLSPVTRLGRLRKAVRLPFRR